jgi:hypothetical protein
MSAELLDGMLSRQKIKSELKWSDSKLDRMVNAGLPVIRLVSTPEKKCISGPEQRCIDDERREVPAGPSGGLARMAQGYWFALPARGVEPRT